MTTPTPTQPRWRADDATEAHWAPAGGLHPGMTDAMDCTGNTGVVVYEGVVEGVNDIRLPPAEDPFSVLPGLDDQLPGHEPRMAYRCYSCNHLDVDHAAPRGRCVVPDCIACDGFEAVRAEEGAG
jgi:hypothetical protein